MICDTFAGISIWVLNVAMRTIVRNHAHATTRRALGFAIEDIEFRDFSQEWLYSPISSNSSDTFMAVNLFPSIQLELQFLSVPLRFGSLGIAIHLGMGQQPMPPQDVPSEFVSKLKAIYILHSQLIHLVSSPEMVRLDVYDLLLPTIIVSSSYLPCAGM